MGVLLFLPIPDVTFVLGNDLAGGNVWSCPDVPPEVVSLPFVPIADECALKYPDVFSACALTRSMAKSADIVRSDEVDLCKTFMANPELTKLSSVVLQEKADSISLSEKEDVFKDGADLTLSPDKLIAAQWSDSTLAPLFEAIHSGRGKVGDSQEYFLKDAILMRKWTSPNSPDDWNMVSQIVIPEVYRDMILNVAHNGSAGHLGVVKTYDRILRSFYWPGLKRDVSHYCQTCHVCQMVGKPNQIIQPAGDHVTLRL